MQTRIRGRHGNQPRTAQRPARKATLVARQYGRNAKSGKNYDKETCKKEHGTVARTQFAGIRSKNGVHESARDCSESTI